MKTKLSKRILSLVLAALMVVTSIPLMAFSAFADVSSSDLNTSALDSYAKNLYDEMLAFEEKLDEDVVYADITTAYAKYVAAQKVFDAYVYGTGTSSAAVETAANELRAAADAMPVFTGRATGNAIPTFPAWDSGKTAEQCMQDWAGTGYKNVLKASTAERLTDPAPVGGVKHHIYYAPDAVLLYDGSGDDIILPVMMSANGDNSKDGFTATNDKGRWIWSAYPSLNAASEADSEEFYLDQRWNSNYTNDKKGSTTGNDANWNNNWWAGLYNNGRQIEYNFKTGAPGSITNTTPGYITSARIPITKRTRSGISYSYDFGPELFMANALKYKGTPAEWGQQYNVSWVVSTGGSDNNDRTNTTASKPISVINFTTYAAKYTEAYQYIKSIDLADYGEGGLADYFAAYKNAAAYDPNTSCGADGGYEKCIADMKALVLTNEDGTALLDWNDNITYAETWGMSFANSTEYAALRSAMNSLMTAYNNGVNEGYTDASWSDFIAVWEQAQRVMGDVVANGYVNTGRAQTLADQLNNIKLETNDFKVDTVALELVLDTYAAWKAIFTAETADVLNELVTEIKTTVWSTGADGEERYKNEAAKLKLEGSNQNIVDEYLFQLISAIQFLRINPDSIIVTGLGRYSINSAMAREAEVVNEKDEYSNYNEFQTALNKAAEYKDSLAELSINFELSYDKSKNPVIVTDYQDVYNNYVALVRNIIETREALAPALINLDNGEIMKTVGTTTLTVGSQHGGKDNYNPNVDFDNDGTYYTSITYPSSVILFKTTHDDAKYTFGKASIEFGMNYKTTSPDLNGLDAITINATRKSGNIKQLTWAAGQGGMGNAHPEEIPASDRPYVDAALSYTTAEGSTFSLENIRFAAQNNTSNNTIFAYDNGGGAITDIDADLTGILGQLNGSASKNMQGVLNLKLMNKGKASKTVNADFTVTVPGDTKQTLSAATRPNVRYVTLAGNYFGATYQYYVEPFQGYAGWDFASTYPNGDYAGQEMYSSVMVIDISYLVDLIKECNALTADSNNFTSDSWNNFSSALTEANTALVYTNNTSAEAMRKTVQNRYDALWAAYQALEIPLTFVGKNADGTDKIETVNVLRNYYLNDDLNASEFGAATNYMNQLAAATTTAQTYYSDDLTKRYDLSGWTPEADYDAAVTTKTTFTAEYIESPNLADFTKYNEAVAALKAALSTAEPYYSADTLNAIKSSVEAMTYFAMTDAQKGEVFAPEQSAIDKEMNDIINLTPTEGDKAEVSAADAEIYVAAKKSVLDVDIYNVNAVNVEYAATVTIDGVDYDGLVFDTYAKLDKVVADILNTATKNVYEIKMNGTVVGTAEYGEVVVVDSEGNLHKNTDIGTNYDSLPNVAWTYSYAAPSRGADNFTAAKYMLTATSLGFVVKGNTNLTTAGAGEGEEGYTVKFATNDGRVFDVQYTTNGKVVMPVAPSYAFYTFTGYDNGLVARQELTVTEDTVVTANYVPLAADTFTITYYSSLDNLYDGVAEIDGESYAYNTPVNLSAENVYCWVAETPIFDGDEIVGDEFTVLKGASDTYNFYACQDITVVALTESAYKEIVDDGEYEILYDNDGNIVKKVRDELTGITTYPDAPPMVYAVKDTFEIYNAASAPEKFSLVGSVAVPDDYKVIETGFLVAKNQAATLTLENSGKNGVNRLKTSKIIGDNQFVVNIKASSNMTFKYKAYAIVELPDGSLDPIYTHDIFGATNF